MAHDQLFPDQEVKESKALDVIALALSALIPFYERDAESGALRALAESEFSGRAPLRSLVVSREQLCAAIDALREDALIIGRVSLTRRQMKNAGQRPASGCSLSAFTA